MPRVSVGSSLGVARLPGPPTVSNSGVARVLGPEIWKGGLERALVLPESLVHQPRPNLVLPETLVHPSENQYCSVDARVGIEFFQELRWRVHLSSVRATRCERACSCEYRRLASQ